MQRMQQPFLNSFKQRVYFEYSGISVSFLYPDDPFFFLSIALSAEA